MTTLNTQGWAEFPFTVNGVDFISKIDKDSSFYPQALFAGDVFITINQRAILDIVGDVSTMTLDEIKAKLDHANEGASQAVICLA